MKLNAEIVKALPIPEVGNRIHYFAEAVIRGAKVPRGFGVRVTAAGARSFVMNYSIARRERRYTIGRWPDWSVLRPSQRHATCASVSTAAQIRWAVAASGKGRSAPR